MSRFLSRASLALAALLLVVAARAEDARVTRLRLQRIGDDVYFRLTLAPPADLTLPPLEVGPDLAWLPRLTPRDLRTAGVYLVPSDQDDLTFLGRLTEPGEARLVLSYPVGGPRSYRWVDVPVTIDSRSAEWMPHLNPRPSHPDHVLATNLERMWAQAQATHFSVLEAATGGDGFYHSAREATNRKYHVNVSSLTGALARPRGTTVPTNERRSIDVTQLPAFSAPERHWAKRLAGRTSVVEPAAKLVPDDNWYLHLRDVRTLNQAGQLLASWSGRDQQLLQRYERQMCLGLLRRLAPASLGGVTLTGSDLQLADGTDVTVIVRDSREVRAAMADAIDDARREFGDRLRERSDVYRDVNVESFTTTSREISLHRATLGENVVCSNSAAALRRVIDAAAGRIASLDEALDFVYARSVFRADAPGEDGFAFLSEALVRRLNGPAHLIKEARRRDALDKMRRLTDAALFTAWEIGRLPRSPEEATSLAALRPEDLAVAEGPPVEWYAGREEAVSKVYNKLRFPTPLLELPLDRVTPTEERDYLQSRNLRRLIEPMGLRLALTEERVRVEALVLPPDDGGLVGDLRWWTGGGTTTVRPDAGGLLSAVIHVGPKVHKGLGEWATLRLEDTPGALHLDGDPRSWLYRLPWSATIQVRDAKAFRELLAELKQFSSVILELDWTDRVTTHRGVSVSRVNARPNSALARDANPPGTPRPFLPAIFYAELNGVVLVADGEDLLKAAIDRSLSGEANRVGEAVSGAMTASPRLTEATLEWFGGASRGAADAVWRHALRRTGVMGPMTSAAEADAAALKWLGFVPVASPPPSFGPVRVDWRFDDDEMRATIDVDRMRGEK